MSTDWSLKLDHLKLCTGNIDTYVLEFDLILITSPTHSLLGTDTDMYRHVDKTTEKCNNYFGSVFPSSHPSFCLYLSACLHTTQMNKSDLCEN